MALSLSKGQNLSLSKTDPGSKSKTKIDKNFSKPAVEELAQAANEGIASYQNLIVDWLENSSDECFIMSFCETKNVYVQAVKQNANLLLETVSKNYTKALTDNGVDRLKGLGWVESHGENFSQMLPLSEAINGNMLLLFSSTIECYELSAFDIQIKFEIV